ncbi:MAG: cobaltochelatase subunit CobN [Eubacterium sp.]|nr:cobaltochelatase subunit CobN [Eubacterium sp.]
MTIKIAVIAVSAPALGQLGRFAAEFNQTYGQDKLKFTFFNAADAEGRLLGMKDQVISALTEADLVVADIMGASQALQQMVAKGLEGCSGQRIVIGNCCREYIRLGSFSMSAAKKRPESPGEAQEKSGKNAAKMMHTMRRMALMMGSIAPFGAMKDMKNVFLLMDYWQQAEAEDIRSFMHLILRRYFGMKMLPKEKPCSLRYGIYLKHPETGECYESVKAYSLDHPFDSARPTAALLFYGHSYPNDFLPVVLALYKRLSQRANVLPIAFSQNEDKDLKKLEEYLCGQEIQPAAVVNLMPFRLGAGPMGGDAEGAVRILEKCGVPYFKPFCLTKVDFDQWQHARAVNPGEFLISIMLPELDGGIHTYPVGIIQKSTEYYGTGVEITEIVPMAERIDALCRRIEGFVNLQKKPNAQKKLALICYNYPAGEADVFGGAFLDTFASVAKVLGGLKAAGYQTEAVSAETLKKIFCEEGMGNEPQWGMDAKAAQFKGGDGVVYPIKGIYSGNVFIGVQPVRAEAEAEAHYHDRELPPSGEYLAFYRWLQEVYQADAILHVGTHGTLEFLPGKESGMTADCWPDRLISATPHFYYYYIGNPSEAMVAKRRSHAVLLGYSGPELLQGGLYGGYQELREMIAEYRESRQSAAERCGDILENIEAIAEELKLLRQEDLADLPGDTEAFLDLLEERLYQYETALIPDGLHVIGQDEDWEIPALIRALGGAYIPAVPAGGSGKAAQAPASGKNLVQFDPRLVPTRTAFERGVKIAEETAARYHRQYSKDLETAAVVLWGLETTRSQGETLGQIFGYLGVRLKETRSPYDFRFEIIPREALGRPRTDVVIHICGFFRDMFPGLIDDLNVIFERLAQLKEADSFFVKHTEENLKKLIGEGMPLEQAEVLARSRIFGPKEGEYGTRLTETVRKGLWEDSELLGNMFLEDLSYVYSSTDRGTGHRGVLDMNYQSVSVVSQVRNMAEYELVDLDHYYEFYGGLAKAVENTTGRQAALYIADTADGDPEVMDFTDSFEKGVRTRLLNPKWIDGMLRHGYHGARQIEKRFENVLGFAASTNQVDPQIFSDLEACYVKDENRRQQLQAQNQWAYTKMLERLGEAAERDYWAPDEETMDRIRRAYLETEGSMEV